MASKLYFNVIFIYIGCSLIINVAIAYYKPQILSQSETIIKSGDDHSVVCEGKEPITWTIPIIENEYATWTNITIEYGITNNTELKYFSKLLIQNITFPYVGFYYCHPKDADYLATTKSSKIYLFVQDDEHLSVSDKNLDTVLVTQYDTAVIPCRPTSPDVTVDLITISGEKKDNATYDPKTGYSFYITDLSEQGELLCQFSRDNNEFEILIFLRVVPIIDSIAKPSVQEKSGGHTTVGEQLLLECKISTHANIDIVWTTPTGKPNTNRVTIMPMKRNPDNGIIYQQLIINETTLEDSGVYYCNASDNQNHYSYENIEIKIFGAQEHFINLTEENGVYNILESAGSPSVQWRIDVNGHPEPKLTWLNNNNQTISKTQSNKYVINFKRNEAFLQIKDITITDFGTYTLLAENSFETKSLSLFLNVTDKPTVHIESKDFHLINAPSTVTCTAAAYPQPNIYWSFKACQDSSNCSFVSINETKSESNGLQLISHLTLNVSKSGEVKCYANNSIGVDEAIQGFYVTDVENGLDIFGFDSSVERISGTNEIIIARGESITMICGASLYNYTDEINWIYNSRVLKADDNKYTIERSHTEYTNRVSLTIPEINFVEGGVYSCQVPTKTGNFVYDNVSITVSDPYAPILNETNMIENIEMNLPEKLELYCKFWGLPKPTITWFKNNEVLEHPERIKIESDNQKVTFIHTDVKDEGSYKCEASNKMGLRSKEIDLKFKNKPERFTKWLIGVIAFLIICVIFTSIFTIIKVRKEKLLQKELQIAGLANFEKGALENLNPDLGIDDQAELLPYDKKWEFPIDKLKLGKQLGSGAFGVVMKGEAKGIADDENSTSVAVKMVKRNADHTHIKALASELKIMVHLGKHVNVVNLLGACTKNVAKRELLVIVEFCRYGNLHNYLLRHRDNFINQVDGNTGSIDYNIGDDILERTYSGSSAKSNTQSPCLKHAALSFSLSDNNGAVVQNDMVDYRDDDEMISSNNSVQPEWRSNYKGDYKGTVKPICTKDLLAWAFQVSRGMEYLASRKVLHGDLAARNILLADNNIVKICDFGLAKSMYKNDNYKKRGNGLLPVKWLAIESIRDRVFSTQSDVWSFGIVLWEFFSLARTPYPGIEAGERLYNKLVDGYRMECPEFAPNEMHKMMLDCWQSKPLSRPSFTTLAERIGSMLEDSVRKHYIDLNDPYLVMNTQRLEDCKSDYLAMLSPPNFENLSSPHHYVNDLPPTEDTPGYLCMNSTNIFSPRADDENVFDFNVSNRKNVNDSSVEGTGNELLPMLHTQNESDCESSNCNSPRSPNSFSNPSYHIPPTINNISTNLNKDIVKSSDNYVNMPQNKTAMKEKHWNNPFIKLDDEKKDICHYINENSRVWESTKV